MHEGTVDKGKCKCRAKGSLLIVCKLMLNGSCLYADVKTFVLAPTRGLVSSDRNSGSYDAHYWSASQFLRSPLRPDVKTTVIIESCHSMSVRDN